MFGTNNLGHQDRATGPFRAEPQALDRLEHHELAVAHGKGGGEGRKRKGRDRDLQSLHATDAVAERAADPAADRAEEQRDRAEQARFGLGDVEGCDQGGNSEREHLDVERIQCPAAKTCPERPTLQWRAFAVPICHSSLPKISSDIFFVYPCRLSGFQRGSETESPARVSGAIRSDAARDRRRAARSRSEAHPPRVAAAAPAWR